ncbi:MAG: FAD-binding protein [Promethearchaeota archaeon]
MISKISKYHTIIIGSGAAGLSCALELTKRNIPAHSILIITENLGGGTSFDAGSDKQTYYKLSLAGDSPDSPVSMAHSLFDGGAMHGDIALIEATCSTQAFMNLVNIGVPFPHDEYGTFVGYKTDNDPLQRGTSAGPLTSHLMGTHLLREVKARGIVILDQFYVLQILKDSNNQSRGILAIDKKKIIDQPQLTKEALEECIQVFQSDFLVLATGGPSGMYGKKVYPKSQWGATSLAIMAGTRLQNLTESQYGLASLKFRWNISGTYQQVLPRYISVAQDQDLDPADSQTECVEFLREYFPSNAKLLKATFLKGYQWPFNVERIQDYGSSLIDFAVHIETVVRNRRVYLDFRQNPSEFSWDQLDGDVKSYLEKSEGVQNLPIERLHHMNPKAIDLYKKHGIDIWKEPLEIGLCAQHCNGGVTGDIWWQTSISRLFAIGEVNGSHGIHRPGGSALNSGQVGAIRAAEKIAYGRWDSSVDDQEIVKQLEAKKQALISNLSQRITSDSQPDTFLSNLLIKIQTRMMGVGAYIRDLSQIFPVLNEIKKEIKGFFSTMVLRSGNQVIEMWKTYDALITQLTYLTTYRDYLIRGGGSRGSFAVISKAHDNEENTEKNNSFIPHPKLEQYRIKKNNSDLNEKIQEISLMESDSNDWIFSIDWIDRRPIPETQGWFETVWKKFDEKSIFL